MKPWLEHERELAATAGDCDLYLGGDGPRPYAVWSEPQIVRCAFMAGEQLQRPPFLAELLRGRYGVPVVRRAEAGVEHLRLPAGDALTRRLRLPRMMLIGLGDTERYRGARLALGIARLGQWLRYTHSAHVTIYDYNLMDDPVGQIGDHLQRQRFDVIGVSVNFGQWQMLEQLTGLVNEHAPQLVVLGNILAAYSPHRAASMFDAVRTGSVLVATTLGERPLEAVCRNLERPERWGSIPGLIRPVPPTGNGHATRPNPGTAPLPATPVTPPDLIFPDDELVLGIAERGGQVSLETSFGCQFSACTFCPRDHRGEGWVRGQARAVVAMLERIAPSGAVVSFVDEEFFGTEGLIDPPTDEFAAPLILQTCRRLAISYEIYTRLEQIVDRRRSRQWNLARAALLAREASCMRRIFVGVESGSNSQLRRYGKGQNTRQIVDALRVGTALGVPMEFGFITLDPLLSPSELAENVLLLSRRDIMKSPAGDTADERVAAVAAYLDGTDLPDSGIPLYQHVAYMATELEVLAHSRYAEHLRRRHPELLDGEFDSSFARYGVRYRDDRIEELAGWCRVWTEGMFAPVYEARMTARSSGSPDDVADATALVARYREATFALLVALTRYLLPELRSDLAQVTTAVPRHADDPPLWLDDLACFALPGGRPPAFDLALRGRRRDR